MSGILNPTKKVIEPKYLREKYGFEKSQLKACMNISISGATQNAEKEKMLKKLEDVKFKMSECERYLNDEEKKKEFQRICNIYGFC